MSQRIVIVGAGFVGVRTATLLRRLAPGDVDVVLIDAKESFLFSPRLIDALASQTDETHHTAKLKSIASKHRFRFVQGIVTNIDQQERRVFITKPVTNEIAPIPYDLLVLCPGADTNSFDIPGAEAFAFPLKTTEHVAAIHVRAKEAITSAAQEIGTDAQKQLLSFVTVGGGPTGIEAICALRQYILTLANETCPDLLPLISFTLVQAAPQILPGFPPHLVQKVTEELKKQDVNLVVGDPVAKVTERFLLTQNNQRIDSSLILWCAGVKPNCLTCIPALHCDKEGCLVTDHFLRATGRIFAAGDYALYREQNLTIPKNAQTAMLMAETIVKNILHTIHRQPLQPFRYHAKGNLLILGNTGIFDFRSFSIKSSLIPWVRDLIYRYRFEQLAK